MAEDYEVSEADRADDIEVDPLAVDDKELFTDDRPEELTDEAEPIDERPDYEGEQLRDF